MEADRGRFLRRRTSVPADSSPGPTDQERARSLAANAVFPCSSPAGAWALFSPTATSTTRHCRGCAAGARARRGSLAVVSLPEETFRSADATVKASLVFFRRFTAAAEAAWEAAWTEAHLRHDDAFNAKRDALCSDYGRRTATGESARIGNIVDELAMLGVERTEPAWRAGTPPDYPRGIGPTRLANPRWSGTASDRKRAAQLKRDYADAFDDDEDAKQRADALLRELRVGSADLGRDAQRRSVGHGARDVRLSRLRRRTRRRRYHLDRRDGRERAGRFSAAS